MHPKHTARDDQDGVKPSGTVRALYIQHIHIRLSVYIYISKRDLREDLYTATVTFWEDSSFLQPSLSLPSFIWALELGLEYPHGSDEEEDTIPDHTAAQGDLRVLGYGVCRVSLRVQVPI